MRAFGIALVALVLTAHAVPSKFTIGTILPHVPIGAVDADGNAENSAGLAALGNELVACVQMAIDDINGDADGLMPFKADGSGPLLPGVTLQSLTARSGVSASTSVQAYMHQTGITTTRDDPEDNAQVIVGAIVSGVSRGLQNVAGIFGTPQISPTSSMSALSVKADFPTFMRTCPPDNKGGLAIATLTKHYGFTKAVILFQDDGGFTTGLATDIANGALKMGIEVVATQGVFTPEGDKMCDQAEVEAALDVLKATGVQVVMASFGGSTTPTTQMLGAAIKKGMTGEGWMWFGSEGLVMTHVAVLTEEEAHEVGLDSVASLNKALEGAVGATPYGGKAGARDSFDARMKASAKVASIMANVGGYDQATYSASPYGILTYEAVWTIAYALKECLFGATPCGTNADGTIVGTELFAKMMAVNNPDSITGPLKFTVDGDRDAMYGISAYSDDGTFTEKGYLNADADYADNDLTSMADLITAGYKYPGGGTVAPAGVACPAGYWCASKSSTSNACPAGTYNDVAEANNPEACKTCEAGFHGCESEATATKPLPCPTDSVCAGGAEPAQDFQLLNESFKTAAYLMYAISACMSLSCLAWSWVYRTHKVVRAAQKNFLALIAVGTIVSSSTILAMAATDSKQGHDEADLDTTCMLTWWLYSLGFIITMSSLFLKVWRVNKIVNNVTLKSVRITDGDLMMALLSILVVDAIILGAWSGISPLEWHRTAENAGYAQRDSIVRYQKTSGSCQLNPLGDVDEDGNLTATSPAIFMGLIAVVHIGLLLWGCVMLYKTRTVRTEFNESKWVSFAMVSSLQVLLLGIPLLVAITDHNTRFFVACAVIFLNDMSVLVCIFGPKMYAVQWPSAAVTGKGGATTTGNRSTVNQGGNTTQGNSITGSGNTTQGNTTQNNVANV